MPIRGGAVKFLNRVLHRSGYQLIPKTALYDWQTAPAAVVADGSLPDGAAEYLRPDNPRLQELEQRYARFADVATNPTVWKPGYVTPADLLWFRGDNPYVYQLRGHNMNRTAYALTTYFVKDLDARDWLRRLHEDQYFGVVTFDIGGTRVSRDLLDSIVEIYFLEKHFGIGPGQSPATILDIGAGYGRLAHRLVTAVPGTRYLCTDAVAVSTFICEYYLGFRDVGLGASVVPLDEVDSTLTGENIDVAINVHSFSECPTSAIAWWVRRLADARIRYLVVIPNAWDHAGAELLASDRQDMRPTIERYGYRLTVKEPRYPDPMVQQYGLGSTYHYIFELADAVPR